MRTTGFSKVMIAIVFAMASVLTMNAAGPEKVTNVEMDNGRISAKVVVSAERQLSDSRFPL